MTSATRRTLATLALLTATGLIVVGCAVNPATGKRELSLVSSEQELRIGEEGYAGVIAQYGVYPDTSLQAYVDSVGQAVAHVSHLPNLKWTFTLLDDPVVNAFAMPGGYIYVTRGIVVHLNSEAQLAGVLGHEVGHVTARHSAKQITQQQLASVGMGLASAFSKTFRQYSAAAQQALGLMFLKYGRDDEIQADQLGVDYATAANYDPREIPATYHMLGRVSDKAGARLPEYLSTHPDPGNREVRTGELAAEDARGKTGLIIHGNAHLRRTNGVLYGRDPKDGYFEGSHYYNPAGKFDIALPEGWLTQDSREALIAVEPNKAAQMQVTLAASPAATPAEHIAALQSAGKISGAQGSEMTLADSPAWSGHIQVQGQQGPVVLAATLVKRPSGNMIQMLGQSAQPGDANDQLILKAMRSFRTTTDPAKLNVQAYRVKVVKVSAAATLESTLAKLGVQESLREDVAILNNLEMDETLQPGSLLKIVTRAAR